MARDLTQETDVQILQQAVRLLEHENARLLAEMKKLLQEIAELRGQDSRNVQLRLQVLEQQLAVLQKKLFGKSSERSTSGEGVPPVEKPQRKGHGRRPQQLPVFVHKIPLPETEQVCECCGERLIEWEGQYDSSREIHVLRRAFVDIEHHQQKYRCKNGCTVKTAKPPRKLFPGARYSIGVALEIAIQKYFYHMPLARQVRQMRSEGLEVDTQTLWDQLNKLATLLQPVYDRIREFVLSHAVIGADETTWRVMGDKGPEGKKTWMVWTVATDKAVYYRIQNSRSTDAAQKILGGYRGTIVCDGYDAYPALARREPGITLAFCWAHVRRKFLDVQRFFPAETQSIIELINELFAIERTAPPGDSPDALDARRLLRDEKSRVVVAQIQKWALEIRVMPGNGLDAAIRYMTSHWSGLSRFLEDPRIPISNNITERANRDPVLGRKNHYGSRSERGTQVAAILYSILETTKNCGIDAHAYLELAVEAALEGRQPLLPHELIPEATARAEQHVALAAEYLAN